MSVFADTGRRARGAGVVARWDFRRGQGHPDVAEHDPRGHVGTESTGGFGRCFVRDANCRPGGGGKSIEELDPTLVLALEQLVGPETRGDPMSPLRWTLKSTSKLAKVLTDQGHPVLVRNRGGAAQGGGLQPAGQSQDPRRFEARGPRCAVSPV